MILTCPNCQSHFKVSEEALGPQGRKVKCATCAEVWFQTPAPVEIIMEDAVDPFDQISEQPDDNGKEEEQFSEILDNLISKTETAIREEAASEPIPDSIKPVEEQFVRKSASPKLPPIPQDNSRKTAYTAVAAVFFLSLCIMLMFKETVMLSFPASRTFYAMFGAGMDVPGTSLVFDKMVADMEKGQLKIEGNIINLGRAQQMVPMMEASLRDEKGEVINKWYIEPPEGELKGENSMPFHSVSVLKTEPESKAVDVMIRFVLDPGSAKTAAKDDDNTPAPHQDAENHQTAP